MSVAKTVELSASSNASFDDAVKQGIKRAGKTIEGIREAWVKDMKVVVQNDEVREYRVHMLVTFELRD